MSDKISEGAQGAAGEAPAKPKVYAFINSHEPEWYVGCAIAEDGCSLAGHASSSPAWAQHDMGYTSDWKHDRYAAHYPDGYEVVWVDDPKTHPGLQAAYALNQQLASAARAAASAPPEKTS